MAQWHKEPRQELEARIPRGAGGSLQNQFRCLYWFYRAQANSFDASAADGYQCVRKEHPDFIPVIAP